MDAELLGRVASSLLTPVVAVVAVAIAYRQYRVERLATKHSLFDRRFRVYQETLRFVQAATLSEGFGETYLAPFRQARNEAQFLYGPDIGSLLETFWDKGVEILIAEDERRRSPPEAELAVVYRIRDHQQWFVRAQGSVTDAFRKYLSVV
jgi:hypothetical protein